MGVQPKIVPFVMLIYSIFSEGVCCDACDSCFFSHNNFNSQVNIFS